MIELLLILIGLILVAACGVFVAAEFSLVTVDRSKIERLANNGDSSAKGVLAALKSLSTQLSGAQVGITVTNLGIGFLAEPAVADLLRGPLSSFGLSDATLSSVAIILAMAIATIVTMVFGELVPKNLAIARPVGTAKSVQGLQRSFSVLMKYPIVVMNGTANIILRRLGIEPREELASARSVEELLSVVRHSAKRGTLTKDTAMLVERSIEFNERHANDVMTPRVKLETIEKSDPVTKVIDLVRESGFSRFPVVDDGIDNVVGVVGVKQAVAVPPTQRASTTVETIMNDALFVPASMELDDLIEKMRDESEEMVITMDEYGGVDGIVTLEDLIEELVGEVIDEHDETGVAVKRLQHNRWSISGLLRTDEVSQVIGLVIPEDESYETIGGLILDSVDEVPEIGDSITVEAMTRSGAIKVLRLKVTRMDGRRIDRIELSVTRLQRSAS